jgi:hypothetical protein
MPKGFTVQGVSGSIAASSTKTMLTISTPSNQLVQIVRLRASQDTHKTSEQYEFYGQRASANGTGTAYTPVLKEPNAGAVNTTAKITHTVEPTYTASTIFPSPRFNSLQGKELPYPMGQELYVSVSAHWGAYATTPSATTTMTANGELEAMEVG